MTNMETITVSKAKYEALVQHNEDLEDVLAAIDADRTSARVPHVVAVAIANGESPITAFRTHRGLSLRELAKRVETSAGYLSEIEGGIKPGSAAVLARIARELGTTIDALLIQEKAKD